MDIHTNDKSPEMPIGSFRQIFRTLSRCGLGAFLLDEKNIILHINEAGSLLLHDAGQLENSPLPEHLYGLLDTSEDPPFCRVTYGEYVMRQPSEPFPGLPEGLRIIVFRDASADYRCAVLEEVVSHLNEGVVISDEDSRLYYCNTAASRMDSLVAENELGEKIESIYRMEDGSECPLPRAIRERRPLLNYRQRYATRHGKMVDAVANTRVILRQGDVLGAFNLMEDWSTVNALHRQIIDLQEKLVDSSFSDAHPEIPDRKDTKDAKDAKGADKNSKDDLKKSDAQNSSSNVKNSAQIKSPQKKSPLTARYSFSDIICVDQKMCRVIKQCRRAARTDSSVIIYGETGTGKELFAQSIHNASPRADGPFLAINCAALPENLLESLLFGSVKGAYTGAENRPGFFEQANHGTLLLDEINSMNISLQAKLLRVLQEGTVRRVGGTAETRVDVRVLSCTNVPPRQAVAEGKMREDLFYRLGVVGINIPPLRERKSDIPLLVSHFIADCNATMMRAVRGIDEFTMEIFKAYSWPGNVRELQHAVEHAMNILPDYAEIITPEYIPQNLLSDAEIEAVRPAAAAGGRTDAAVVVEGIPEDRVSSITDAARNPAAYSVPAAEVSDLSSGAGTSGFAEPAGSGEASLGGRLQEMEKRTLIAVLKENRGNISKSARILRMSRQNLQYRIKRYGIDVEEFR